MLKANFLKKFKEKKYIGGLIILISAIIAALVVIFIRPIENVTALNINWIFFFFTSLINIPLIIIGVFLILKDINKLKINKKIISIFFVLYIFTALSQLFFPNKAVSPIERFAVGRRIESICPFLPTIWKDIKIRCYYEIAVSEKDTKICDKVSGKISQSKCYILFAIYMKDESVCEKEVFTEVSGSQKDYCYFYLAGAKEDINLCKRINNETLKDFCQR